MDSKDGGNIGPVVRTTVLSVNMTSVVEVRGSSPGPNTSPVRSRDGLSVFLSKVTSFSLLCLSLVCCRLDIPVPSTTVETDVYQ